MSIQASELITNPDGSIFHLHLLPEDLADNIILVGDPGRVETVASYFDDIELKKCNREFSTITGIYDNTRISVISTGIGPDNIDIVINELDALVNIDLHTKEIKENKRRLNIIRIGTSGSVQSDIPVGSFVISEKNLGCDGVLRFYEGNHNICCREFEDAFIEQCDWNADVARPYLVTASEYLVNKLHTEGITYKGVTLTAVGFYGPQGRIIRLPLVMPDINDKISAFCFNNYRITNYEMESAPITGLCNLLGHHATTICLIIANRLQGNASADYYTRMHDLIKYTLDKLTGK